MASPFGPLTVIANPRAGRGLVGDELPEVERNLLQRGLEYRIVEAPEPGGAEREARAALASGGRFLVVVGSDGDVHEVVNAMIEDDRPVAPDAVLGVVAAGSGCDFVKTFGLPGDSSRSVGVLAGEKLFPIDVGKVVCATDGGEDRTRYFANIAQAGLGAAVLDRADRLPHRLGKGRYFVGFWSTLTRYRPSEVSVRAGLQEFDGRALNVVVANGQYHGEGRRISPRSWPSDGLFDVLVQTGPKSDAFTRLPQIYHGDHLPDPNIVELKGRRVSVESDRQLPVEADGLVLGSTPARFEIIRLPIRLKI